MNIEFVKRIGPDPHAGDKITMSTPGCPDIWELSDGTFAVIGVDKTAMLKGKLPPTVSCGPEEHIVVIERRILVNAKGDIPQE